MCNSIERQQQAGAPRLEAGRSAWALGLIRPNTMKLADYGHNDRFLEFDPETGSFESVGLVTPRTDRRGYCGVAQLLRVKRRPVLVATYCQEGHAWLSIGAERWPLYDQEFAMTHEVSPWGFTCRFSIRRRDELLICFEYPRQDRLMSVIDSTYDNLDFTLAHLLADVGDYKLLSRDQHLASFIKMWCPQSTAQSRAPADGPEKRARG
jgi:hypothetical protein